MSRPQQKGQTVVSVELRSLGTESWIVTFFLFQLLDFPLIGRSYPSVAPPERANANLAATFSS